MFKHCATKFKSYDTWYLYDNKSFYNRKLRFGKCPKCKKQVAELEETRKADDRIFTQLVIGYEKINNIAELNRNNINYSSQDIKVRRCKTTMPKEIRWGENKIVKIGNKEYLRQNAVSRWGKKECLKDIPQ